MMPPLPPTFLAMNVLGNTILGGGLPLLLTSSLAAQSVVHETRAEAPGDAFGASLALSADLDGDGVDDLWVGAPRTDFGAPNAGSAYALSGASGQLLFRVDGSVQGELFGRSVAAIGDLDGDGLGDLLVGAPFHPGTASFGGSVFALSSLDGSPIHAIPGNDSFGLLGMSVAAAGDVDGDGTPDILAGGPLEDGNGTDAGSVYVFSGASGALIVQRVGDTGGDELGTSVAGLGDLDGDGLADYAAGAPYDDNGGNDAGSLRVWSSQSGLALYTLHGNSTGDSFGLTLASLDDIDGDGRRDLAIGAPFDDLGGPDAGSVRVVSGATGALLFQLVGSPGDTLGDSLGAAGDVDGDGTPDLLVGGRQGNLARAHSGVDGALLLDLPAPDASSAWGAALVGGLDIDGDGRAEVAVSDELSPAGGTLVVFADHSLLGTSYCSGDGSATGCPCGNTGGAGQGCANSSGSGATLEADGTASVTGDDLVLRARDLVPGQAALLFAGLNRVQAGNGLLFGDGLRCAAGAVVRLGVRLPSAAGAAEWGPGLIAAQGWSAGQTRRFQVWYRDPLASPCGAGFNLSNGFELDFVQ